MCYDECLSFLLIKDVVVNPVKIKEVEEFFDPSTWDGNLIEKRYTGFVGATFTLNDKNELVNINSRCEEDEYNRWKAAFEDGGLFATKLSRAPLSGSIILKFKGSDHGVDP